MKLIQKINLKYYIIITIWYDIAKYETPKNNTYSHP